VTGDATASGAISLLAAGATDSSSIHVGVVASAAGTRSGTVILVPSSDGLGFDDKGTTALASQTITVSGSVFRLADASVAVPSADPTVHVGDTVAMDLAIANAAPADGYSEKLRIAIDQTTGGFTARAPVGEIAPGTSGQMIYGVPTTNAGLQTGTITLDFASDGIGIDGYAATPSGTQTVAISVMVDNYATAQIVAVGNASLHGTGSSFTLDFGHVAQVRRR
jgi:hypothetical protein